MSTGELAYLALVIGCFAVFAAAVTWLRSDYVKFRRSHPSAASSFHAHPAE